MSKTNNISQKIFLLVLAIATILICVQNFVLPQYNTVSMYIVPCFFVALYFVAFIFVLNSNLTMQLFVRRFIVFKTVKSMLTLAAMLISAYVCRDEAKQLLVSFLAYYLLMLLPETLYAVYMKKNAGLK